MTETWEARFIGQAENGVRLFEVYRAGGSRVSYTLFEKDANLIAAAPVMYAEIVAIAAWFGRLEDEAVEGDRRMHPELFIGGTEAAIRAAHAHPHLAALRAIIAKVEAKDAS